MNKKVNKTLLKSFMVLLQKIHKKGLFLSTEFVEGPLKITILKLLKLQAATEKIETSIFRTSFSKRTLFHLTLAEPSSTQ